MDPASILWRAFFKIFFYPSTFFSLSLSARLQVLGWVQSLPDLNIFSYHSFSLFPTFFPSFLCPPLISSSPFPLPFFLFSFSYSFPIPFLSFSSSCLFSSPFCCFSFSLSSFYFIFLISSSFSPPLSFS